MAIKIVPKVWGHEEWIANTDKYCGKRLILKKGHQCSLHYHKIKDETFYVDGGKVKLELGSRLFIMEPGDFQRVRPNEVHRFAGLETSIIYEFSTHHDEKDSYRLAESCKIKSK